MLNVDLFGAEVLGSQGLAQGNLSMADGLIVDHSAGRSVDLTGYRVLPGIIVCTVMVLSVTWPRVAAL